MNHLFNKIKNFDFSVTKTFAFIILFAIGFLLSYNLSIVTQFFIILSMFGFYFYSKKHSSTAIEVLSLLSFIVITIGLLFGEIFYFLFK